MKTISLINNKGGVGKTTSAVNIAAALAALGRRVVLVDLDAQGSASLSLGFAVDPAALSCADVLFDNAAAAAAVYPTENGVYIMPSSERIASADIILGPKYGREKVLQTALNGLHDFDYCLIDCPPSLSLVSVNALVASDYWLIPVTPHYLALEGLANLTRSIARLDASIALRGRLLGILPTMVDYRTRAAREIVDILRAHFKGDMFKTEIGVNVRLSEAQSFGKDIFNYDSRSTGADGYSKATKEMISRIGKDRK